MQGLVDYASSGSGEEEEEEVPAVAVDPLAGPTRSLSTDSDASPASSSGDAASDDSAAARAAAAAAKLARLDEVAAAAAAAAARPPNSSLPDPLAALDGPSAPPAFLHPEATQPLAAPLHRGGAGLVVRPAVEPPPAKRARAAEPAAPPPPPPPAGPASAAVEAAQWASAATSKAASGKGVPEGPSVAGAKAKGKATAAMPVAEALATGAALPRKGQTMKDRQKAKAGAGQRATGEWKPEAFMIMRQQYD